MPRSAPRLGRRGAILLAAMVALLAGWIWLARREAPAEPVKQGVLSAIPEGAMLIAVVDVAALRASELGRSFLGEGRSIAGLGQVGDLCGADPMDSVDELAIAVPAEGIDSGFGLFASGAFVADRLMSCAERIVSERGGRPVREPRGRFALLRDTSLDSSAVLAVSDGGPLVLAERAYVEAALDAAHGDHRAHAALRERVQPGAVVTTVVLSAEQRRTLADELTKQGMADSPFARVTSAALSLGVSDHLRVHGVLRSESAEAAQAIAAIVDRARRDEAQSTAARVVGLSALLEAVRVRASGDSVHLTARIPVAEALALVRRLVALRQLAVELPLGAPAAEPVGSAEPAGAAAEPVGSSAPSAAPVEPAGAAGARP